MRSRTVRPEFWSDEKLAKVSRDARLMFIGLWTTADDYGVTKGHPAWLKSQIYPYDESSIKSFEVWLRELVQAGMVFPFSVNGERYLWIKNFLKHQKVNRPSAVRNPVPPEQLQEDSLSTHGVLTDETDTDTDTDTESETEAHSRVRLDEMFASFWAAYPKNVGKKDAAKAFKRLSPSEELFGLILKGVEQQKLTTWAKKEKQYILNPASWLNGEHWEDELVNNATSNQAHQVGTIGRDEPPEPSPEDITATYQRELARINLDITDWEGRRIDTPNRATILAGLRRRREEIEGLSA